MKKNLFLIPIILACGCAVIPTDMFPKFTWYWSKDAREYRASKTRMERNYEASTNQVTNPK